MRMNQFHSHNISAIAISVTPKAVEIVPAVPKIINTTPATPGAAMRNQRVAAASTPDVPAFRVMRRATHPG
jgi:hypothetical protein